MLENAYVLTILMIGAATLAVVSRSMFRLYHAKRGKRIHIH
jgi:multisubunit Na+/H+ antiporter MnhC subunit